LEHLRTDLAFFGEIGASFFISFPEDRWKEVQDVLGGSGSSGGGWVAYDDIGFTGGKRFKIGDYIDLSLEEMKEAYGRDLFV
jgi:hypothetical protein